MRAAPLSLAMLLSSMSNACTDDRAPAPPPTDGGMVEPNRDMLRFDQAVFRATHNSYEGGARGTFVEQLEAGIRFLELDVHDDDFTTVGYRIGHDAPGDAALGAGNPDSDAFEAWLEVVARWSSDHPDHAPITLGIDVKDPIWDNPTHADGNLTALYDALEGAFGERLYTPDELGDGQWPTIGEMRGRVVAVLSGDRPTRLASRRAQGASPAVAVDAAGRAFVVYEGPAGTLHYFSGQIGDDGVLMWRRYGTYGTGGAPAAAMHDGVVVETHVEADEGVEGGVIVARRGVLDAAGEVAWSAASITVGTGIDPTLRFVDGEPLELLLVYAAPTGEERFASTVTIDGETLVVTPAEPTALPLHARSDDSAGEHTIAVSTGADGAAPADTLLAQLGDGAPARIRLRPILFVEQQREEDPDLDGRFYAARSASVDLVERWRADGRLIRLWGFAAWDAEIDPPVQYPATDTPMQAWYQEFIAQVDAVE